MEPTDVIEAINAFKSVYEFLKDTKKFLEKSRKRGWKMFSSKKAEAIEKRFKEGLNGSKNAMESNLWLGKGYAIQAECGIKVNQKFHDLMALLINHFNEISMRLIPEKLDEKLVDHIMSQLKTLEHYATQFKYIQGTKGHTDKEKQALEKIEDFRVRLWDFYRSMEPYLKPLPQE